jgi:CheY-like chemotaxis protein
MSIGSHFFTSRKVLLFDTDRRRRDGRADSLRERGIEVTCASDVDEARLKWSEDFYRLVLVDTGNSPKALEFSDEIRAANPKQLLAFFVRKPTYLSVAPETGSDDEALSFDSDAALSLRLEEVCQALSPRNGFREASLRMLAVRYVKRRQHS